MHTAMVSAMEATREKACRLKGQIRLAAVLAGDAGDGDIPCPGQSLAHSGTGAETAGAHGDFSNFIGTSKRSIDCDHRTAGDAFF